MADAQTQAADARDEIAAKRQRDALARNNLAASPAPASPAVGAASSAGRGGGMKEESAGSLAQRTPPAASAGAANEQRPTQSTVLAKVTGDKARSADDYIATIRRLRGEGKFEKRNAS
jgi:hypothetical protein